MEERERKGYKLQTNWMKEKGRKIREARKERRKEKEIEDEIGRKCFCPRWSLLWKKRKLKFLSYTFNT